MITNNFICLDDEFTYSRCVYQCSDCQLYEKQLEENKGTQNNYDIYLNNQLFSRCMVEQDKEQVENPKQTKLN